MRDKHDRAGLDLGHDWGKRRWAIELFFRWVKQTLKIRRFMGLSENAVRIQIAVAPIAFLLLRLAQAGQRVITSPARLRSPDPPQPDASPTARSPTRS
jgi:IS4 transposase